MLGYFIKYRSSHVGHLDCRSSPVGHSADVCLRLVQFLDNALVPVASRDHDGRRASFDRLVDVFFLMGSLAQPVLGSRSRSQIPKQEDAKTPRQSPPHTPSRLTAELKARQPIFPSAP